MRSRVMLPTAPKIVRACVVPGFLVCCLGSSIAETRGGAPKTPARDAAKARTVVAQARTPRVEPALVAGAVPATDQPTARDTNLLEEERARRLVRAERLNRDVLRTIEASRKQGMQDPGAALAELKRALTTVISSTDIDPDARENLRAKVQANIDYLLVAREKI